MSLKNLLNFNLDLIEFVKSKLKFNKEKDF